MRPTSVQAHGWTTGVAWHLARQVVKLVRQLREVFAVERKERRSRLTSAPVAAHARPDHHC